MARVTKNGIKGAVGPIVFSEHRGVGTARAKNGPGKEKQTEETKSAATIFGTASKFAGMIRRELGAHLHFIADGDMLARLNAQVLNILLRVQNKDTKNYDFNARSFKALSGFEFNIKSPLKDQLWTLPETRLINGKLRFTLPEIDIKKELSFPKDANSCTVFLAIRYGSLKTKEEKFPTFEMAPILEISAEDTHTTAQQWTFAIPEGCYCMTAIALNYHHKFPRYQLSLNTPEMSPAMICDFLVNPGTFTGQPDNTWVTRTAYFPDKPATSSQNKTKNKAGAAATGDPEDVIVEETKEANCRHASITPDNPFIMVNSVQKNQTPEMVIHLPDSRPDEPVDHTQPIAISYKTPIVKKTAKTMLKLTDGTESTS